MSHPLDEMTPVLLKIPGASGTSPRMCFANDANQKIVGVVENLGLVVTVNKLSGLHSVWRIEKAQVEDYAHLYLIDEDGRITVAPEALTVVDEQSLTAPLDLGPAVLSTPIDTKGAASSASRQATPLQHRFQHLSLVSSPFLSPFRASLQKLKYGTTSSLQPHTSIINDSASDDSVENLTGPGISPQPVDLDEHIRRLSAVSFVPPPRSMDDTHHPVSQQNSVFAMETVQSFRRNRRNSKSSGLFTKPRSRQNSLTLGCSTIPGVFATSSHPECLSHIGELQALQLGLDEPLLPKVCLTLLWREQAHEPDDVDQATETPRPRIAGALCDWPPPPLPSSPHPLIH
ncbi:unnamed protein product [Mesocestoides corti]|uniref:Anaphase-promoting complex subunit 1 n=1 Tax=Mesocestoides corti TaxID=53468 RepID=A0A0R3UC11_MESCO|nr:unnamed protein product [Mesocestoides corti]